MTSKPGPLIYEEKISMDFSIIPRISTGEPHVIPENSYHILDTDNTDNANAQNQTANESFEI